MTDKQIILDTAEHIFNYCPGNILSEDEAVLPAMVGIKLFERPLIGFGSANDTLFETFRRKDVIGPWHMPPEEWMSGANTVIEFFFPFTKEVREANRKCTRCPSSLWLHGRLEGQKYLVEYITRFAGKLQKLGINTCVPITDPRFLNISPEDSETMNSGAAEDTFYCNWSERHAAYVCGLGTFGLSRGLITNKGTAGRLVGIITDAQIPPDKRDYSGVYDYCSGCGACIKRCPVKAISKEHGKDHILCNGQINKVGELNYPRYGCGLCQTKVPCESTAPKKLK